MQIRQEPLVFTLSVLLVAWLSWDLMREAPASRVGRTRATQAEFEHHHAPPVGAALVAPDLRPRHDRQLFSPPRDTHPLPPLDPVEPWFEPLPALLPPTVPGPGPAVFGRLLRTRVEVTEVPGLFDGEGELGSSDQDLEFLAQAAAPEEGSRSLIPALRELADESESDPYRDETAEERLARFQSYQRRYDWLVRYEGGPQVFGRIENPRRFELTTDRSRDAEPIVFTEIDPETGRERFAGVGEGGIPYDRANVHEFHFAQTFANEIELERLRIGSDLNRTDYDAALVLAQKCVARRLDAPRALEIATELYGLCMAFDPEDLSAQLGFGKALEAGFQFEEAFALYDQLQTRFDHHAVVHVRMGLLEERLLLIEEAEARLRRALQVERNSWEALWGLGGFLARRGEHADALEFLERANRLAPQDPARIATRVAIRVDHADAHFALGNVDEARRLYNQALGADAEHARARAGVLGCDLVAAVSRSDAPGGETDELGREVARAGASSSALGRDGEAEIQAFELSLARGIEALVQGRHEVARDEVILARDMDPLRSNHALGALSFLAEVTAHDELALQFAEQALEVDPGDAYALYQRGRLLGAGDDYEGARASLLAALDAELDFEDALVALGDVAFRLGRFEDADRFLERAVSLNPTRAGIHALRGWNFIRLGFLPDARSSFEAALEHDPDHPQARGGLAWCVYLGGDPEEALIQLADLDEVRRRLPEDDVHRAWARAEVMRLSEHMRKVAWRDEFNRKRLRNGWITRMGAGPLVSMWDGAVRIEGTFDENGKTQVFREYSAGLFVSFEALVKVSADNVRCGVFIARERQRRNSEPEVLTEASISRHKEGGLQLRIITSGRAPEETDMQQLFPTDQWVRLRIERSGEASASSVTLSIDGIPLVENVGLSGLGVGSTTPLIIGFFAEGETGRRVSALMDDVEVVYSK